VYVVTSADAAELQEWAASLEPDELPPGARDTYGWGVAEGFRGFSLSIN
jgi:hypothetical protein